MGLEKSMDSTGDMKKVSMEKSIRYKDENNNDVTKRMEVEEVMNGYIITISKSYYDEKDNYKYDSKKYISKENPMAAKEEKMDEGMEMKELVMSLDKMF